MAKAARCEACKLHWYVRILDQTPVKELRCPECKGPVVADRTRKNVNLIYDGYRFPDGEPEHGKPVIANVIAN